MLDMFEKGMQPEYVDFHKDGKTILYGDSNKCSDISLSKHLLPQCPLFIFYLALARYCSSTGQYNAKARQETMRPLVLEELAYQAFF